MIRLLHFADIHIGVENYGRANPQTGLSSRVTDFLRRMDEMVAYAQERGADLAIFAGDAFKNRNPNPTFQREFAWRILDLASICPVVLLVGNHDLPVNVRKASSIEIYDTLRVPNVWVGDHYELLQIDTESGPVKVATAPYPVRARLMEDDADSHGRRTIADLDILLQEKLELILRDLANEARQAEMPRVLTGHFSIHGALRGSEKQVMLGRDIAVTLANIADPVWDYVAMGHIHQHQNMTNGRDDLPPIVYSGSMERIDFGEEGDEKGFVWVELERSATRWEFVALPARPFVTLRVDIRAANNPTEAVMDRIRQHDLTEAVVRLLIQADPESNAMLNIAAIERNLREAGANMVAGIQRHIEQPERERLGPTPEGLAPLELLERYFASRELTSERIERLLQAAQSLLDETHP
ncbi:MAG: exonuclease SbcCD subunit D [Chloroflexi bacterium]|nr:exonuclease SbcCD subunit D [Chloroflexota bacterium]